MCKCNSEPKLEMLEVINTLVAIRNNARDTTDTFEAEMFALRGQIDCYIANLKQRRK